MIRYNQYSVVYLFKTLKTGGGEGDDIRIAYKIIIT